jgi:isoquinoline 1-oxidoreductase alpha subunit
MTILTVNGVKTEIAADPDTPLLWVIRDQLELTGTKFGCGIAACGACTVLLDGQTVRSCQIAVGDADGSEVTTIEGDDSAAMVALNQAWVELQVPQCGYCQSGQLMSAAELLRANPSPSDQDIDAAMWGNACRCATYHRIRNGIHRAAEILKS